MTTVFVVLVGEYGEGGSVLGIFKTLESACLFAPSVGHMHGSPWEEKEIRPDAGYSHEVRKLWRSGCDWMTVSEHEVGE
jgi:hypothetical protein